MKVHFLSGLGADKRVYRLLELPGVEKVFIKWEKPKQRESLAEYAKRLLKQINTEGDVILIGVSFGGIIAQEIAKLLPCKKVFIISSIKSRKELPWQLHLIKKTGIYKFLPVQVFKDHKTLAADYLFSTKSKGESILLKQIIKDTDDDFLKWAIGQIMEWKNDALVDDLVHIHGTKDRIFPYNPIQNCIPIEGGGHFMIVNRANEISKVILQNLKEVNPSIKYNS